MNRTNLVLALALVSTACDSPSKSKNDDADNRAGDPCDAETENQARPCAEGTQFCVESVGMTPATYSWGTCVAEPVCEPGEIHEDGCQECQLASDGTPGWTAGGCGESTPLVLRFDDAPVRYSTAAASFDLGPECGATDWPEASTPWLALDRDGSGTIDGGHELFGSATRLRGGDRAVHGFAALAELDHDRDGRVAEGDPEFARLVLWADHDLDRRSTGWELTPVTTAGLVSIDLTYASDRRCDARANCEVERAAFTFRDAVGRTRTGEVVDVHLACQ